MEKIIKLDQYIFIYLNNNLHAEFFDKIFYTLNLFGNWWILAPVCLCLIYFYNRKDLLRYSILLIICGVVSGGILHFLKWYIERPRPLSEFEILIEQGTIVIYTLGEKLKGNNSFPSGHTQTAFTGAAFFYYFFRRKYSILFFVFAFFVGIARIYSGVHYPLDVLGGALIGILPVFIIYRIYEKYSGNYSFNIK
ncbi:phosphatase PAP2 family protein [Candidatus Desantisbacteria bacterium]|nr:phosphatase PAP2 family protein [Candidatus Desantisbacteria bacterium]